MERGTGIGEPDRYDASDDGTAGDDAAPIGVTGLVCTGICGSLPVPSDDGGPLGIVRPPYYDGGPHGVVVRPPDAGTDASPANDSGTVEQPDGGFIYHPPDAGTDGGSTEQDASAAHDAASDSGLHCPGVCGVIIGVVPNH
jgi:hypothetical protein